MRLPRLQPPQSLRGQFSLAVLALSLLIATGCLISVVALHGSAETSRQLAEERLQHLHDARDLLRHTLQIERETYRMLTVDSVDDMQRSYGEITTQMAIIDTLVIRLSQSDTDIAVLSLHQSGQLFRNTAHIIARLRKDILENSATAGALADLHRFRGHLEAQVAVMASAANELSDHLSHDYREKILELAATSRKDQRLVLALGAGGLLLAWLVSRYFLGGHVVGRLRLVSRYLRSGDDNGEEIRVPVRGHDEIGEMARAVEQFLEDRRQLTEAQLSLRQSEEMLRAITDAVQSAVFLIDDEDRIQFVNPAAEAMFGYRREEILGRRLHETIVPERFREQAGEGLSAYRITGKGAIFAHPRELAGRRKDGTELDILLLVGRVFKNGRWWAAGSIIDITERLAAEAELKKTQTEAMHAARLASIGQLAAGIAHEINTPAQYVSDNIKFICDASTSFFTVLAAARNLAREAADLESATTFAETCDDADIDYLIEELPAAIRQSLEGIDKVSRIVASLKEFSHPGGGAKEMVDLNRAIENAVTITHSIWKDTAGLETRLDPELPPVFCRIGEMNQVFLNLIVNGAQAIEQAEKEGPGEIVIATQAAGEEVVITVTDTGGGVPAEIRDQIFHPFFTTRPVGKGSGQGLAICYDIVVNKHRGRIEVSGVPGEGAVFTVRLPVR